MTFTVLISITGYVVVNGIYNYHHLLHFLSALPLPFPSISVVPVSLFGGVTQTFIPDCSRPLVVLLGLGCSFPLTLITGYGNSKSHLKASPELQIYASSPSWWSSSSVSPW